MLVLFRDVMRFGYYHGVAIALLISPYVALVFAARACAALWAPDQPLWYWFYYSVVLAVYPLYMGRVIKYLARQAGPPQERPDNYGIDAEEWRRLFLINLATTILVGCGVLLLIVPGAYLAARLAFAEFITLLRPNSPFDSMHKSWGETVPQLGPLFTGALVVLVGYILLELPLQVQPSAPPGVHLAAGLVEELVSLLTSLALTVFFFRVYCLADPRA